MSPGRIALLTSARELFGERGYRGASIREIARRAGVSEALVYRHFDTKEHLFEESLLGPIRSFVTGFIAEWRKVQAESQPPLLVTVRQFAGGMYDLAREHRGLLQAHFFAHTFDGAPAAADGAVVSTGFLDDLASLALSELTRDGFRPTAEQHYAITVLSRAAVACVIAFALMDRWLFDVDDPVVADRDGLIDCVAAMVAGSVDLIGRSGAG